MFEIVPGILEQEWGKIEQKLEKVLPFARTIHVDLLDGKFANNTTLLDPSPFKQYTGRALFELHMMVDDPLSHVQKWVDAGFRRFIGHVEKMPDQVSFVAEVQRQAEVGLALDGPTPVEMIKVPLEDLDTILVMTIKAGFSGQAFQPELLTKVKKLSPHFRGPIEVDGGINDLTIKEAQKNGVTRFVTTSFLFRSSNPQDAFTSLHHCLGSAE